MALPASLTAALGTLLTDNWAAIVADANANSGVTIVSFSLTLTETSPPGGPMDANIRFTHRFRTEISQSTQEQVTVTVS
jgi:hypothetical protein